MMLKQLFVVLIVVVIIHTIQGHYYDRHHHPKPCVPKVFDPKAKITMNGAIKYIFSSIRLNFHDAQNACVAACGNLVSIDNAAEQNYINTQLGTLPSKDAWYIGLLRVGGIWIWLTGERITYQNWIFVFPPTFGDPFCAFQSPTNKWVAHLRQDCIKITNRFICEVK